MRKVTVVMDPEIVRRIAPRKFHSTLDKIESMDGKHLVKLDPRIGVKVAIADIRMKDGYTIRDLELGKGIKILDVFQQEGNTYTCLIKVTAEMNLKGLARLLDFDLIFEPPFHYDSKRISVSFVSDDRTIRLVLAALKLLGRVVDIKVQNAVYTDKDPIAVLTGRQKEALLAAKRLGYYDIPRKAGTQRVAAELKLSKATALEHLRKAERRLIDRILSGR
jgi:predicted DNA binding protein